MCACLHVYLHYASLGCVHGDHGCTVQHEGDLVVWVVNDSKLLNKTHKKTHQWMHTAAPCWRGTLTALKLNNTVVNKCISLNTSKVLTFILASIHFILVAAAGCVTTFMNGNKIMTSLSIAQGIG